MDKTLKRLPFWDSYTSWITLLWCNHPWLTTAVAVCSVASQLARMASFLLPIKILYLAATPGLPAFFQQLVPTLNRPQVVATLCALAVGLFVVHVACDRGRTHLESKIGQALSGAQPEALVGITSLRFTNVLTNSLRGVIAPTFAIPLMGYLVLTAPGVVAMLLAFTGIIALVLKSHWERFFTWWQSHPVEMISTSKVLSSSTFLAGFGVILFQLLGKTDPSLVIAVTSLIALRLLMNQVNDEVAALQTHGRQGWVWPSQRPADTSATAQQTSPFPTTVVNVPSTGLIGSIPVADLNMQLGLATPPVRLDPASANREMLLATKSDHADAPVAIAASRMTVNALESEAAFISALTDATLAATPKDISRVRDHTVCTFAPSLKPITPDDHPEAKRQFLIKLAAVDATALAPEHTPSMPMQVELGRVDASALNADHRQSLDNLLACWPDVCRELDALPRQWQVRSNIGALMVDADAQPRSVDWSDVQAVPVGMSYLGETLLFDPVEIIRSAARLRPALSSLSDSQIRLAYEVGRLATAIQRERYTAIGAGLKAVDILFSAVRTNTHELSQAAG